MTSSFFRRASVWLFVLALAFGSLRAQEQKPIRMVIVGLEHGHVDGFFREFPKQQDAVLVGVVDTNPALRERAVKLFHLDPTLFYNTLDEAVAAGHPQAVLVYTSVGEHRRIIEAAAAHSLDVMVEKPLSLTLADALAIRKVVRERHIHVLVNYETTWYASNRAVYDLAESGKLGEIRKVVVHDGHQGPAEIRVMPEFLAWLTDPAQNGAGALYDFGCYGADLMTWLRHGEAPVSVTAVSQTDKPATYAHVDDDATIILRYPGAQAVLMPSWNWTFNRKDMEVYGTQGIAVAIDPTQYSVRLNAKDLGSPMAGTPLAAPADTSLHYLEAVVRGQLEPQGDLTALDTNVVVMQILDAARESAATGKTVLLKPLPK